MYIYMNNKPNTIDLFNNNVEKMFDFVLTVIPNNKNIIMARESHLLIKNLSKKKPLELFLKFVYPYRTKILEENEEFFLNLKLEELKDGAEQIKVFTNMWKNTDDENSKKTLWTYSKVLVKLCERFVKEYLNKNN